MMNKLNLKIAEDFPKEIQKTRKLLIPKLKEARELGKYPVLRYEKLIIKDNNAPFKEYQKNQTKRQLSESPSQQPYEEASKRNKTQDQDAIPLTIVELKTATNSETHKISKTGKETQSKKGGLEKYRFTAHNSQYTGDISRNKLGKQEKINH